MSSSLETSSRSADSKMRAVAVIGAILSVAGIISFGGGVGASTASDPVLLAGPACEEGNPVVSYEVTNPDTEDHRMTMTVGGVTVIDSRLVEAGTSVNGIVDWPEDVYQGSDSDTVVSWLDTGGSAIITHRGDMCSNPPSGMPSRGPGFMAGVICTPEGTAVSFELTNNDDVAHEMNVAISSAASQAAPETVIWPEGGGSELVQPGEVIRRNGIVIDGFAAGTQLRIRAWWRGGEDTWHNRVIATVAECEPPSSQTTTTVPETTTTVEETTTTVPETTTTAVEETTTTVPETTTTVVEETTTTTIVEETTTTVPEETTTTVPEETTTTVQATTTVPTPVTTLPSVRGVTQTPSVLGLAVTGRNVGSLSVTALGLAMAGVALTSIARKRR